MATPAQAVITASSYNLKLGDTVTFTIVLDNTASEITLTDLEILGQLPTGMEFVAGSVVVNGTAHATINPATWATYPNVTAGNYTITMQAKVTAPPSTQMMAGFAISYSFVDPTDGPSGISQIVPVSFTIAQPIILTKTVTSPASVYYNGDTVEFTISVTNNSALDSVISATDVLPSGLANATYSYDSTTGDWTGSLNLGTVEAGETVTFTITATVEGAISESTLTNTVTVTTDLPDLDDLTASATVDIGVMNDMSVTKTANKASYAPGEQVTFTITITNNGALTNNTVTIADEIPTGLLSPGFVVGSETGTWTAWTGSYTHNLAINSGSSVTILIRGTIDEDTTLDSLTNTVTISDMTHKPFDPEGCTDSVTVAIARTASLKITKRSDKAIYASGDTIVYTITVTNNGPNASVPTITDTLPTEVTDATYTYNGTTASWTGSLELESLTAEATATFTITGEVTSASLLNTASAEHN